MTYILMKKKKCHGVIEAVGGTPNLGRGGMGSVGWENVGIKLLQPLVISHVFA